MQTSGKDQRRESAVLQRDLQHEHTGATLSLPDIWGVALSVPQHRKAVVAKKFGSSKSKEEY